jgi:hypothetical protein
VLNSSQTGLFKAILGSFNYNLTSSFGVTSTYVANVFSGRYQWYQRSVISGGLYDMSSNEDVKNFKWGKL